VRDVEGLEREPEWEERWRNEKLRRGLEKDGRLSGDVGELNSESYVGGVMISWLRVSERMNVISGGGGDIGIDGLSLDFSVLSSSRLWRMLFRDGIVASLRRCVVASLRCQIRW
jgi:hypothetical protein